MHGQPRVSGTSARSDGNEEHGTVVGDMLRGLEVRFPGLASWLGGRLDIELPALVMSLTMHGLLLAGLAFAGYRGHQEGQREKSDDQQNGESWDKIKQKTLSRWRALC